MAFDRQDRYDDPLFSRRASSRRPQIRPALRLRRHYTGIPPPLPSPIQDAFSLHRTDNLSPR